MTSSVFDTSPAYREMQEKRDLTEALYAGTKAMREAARKYRYMWPGSGEMKVVKVGDEEITRYELRIRESYLENYWLEGVQGAAAMPFRRSWTISEWDPVLAGVYDADGAKIRNGWLDNIDRTGRAFGQFLSEGFRYAQAHGMDLVLVDLPTKDVPDDKRWPYWVGIRARDMLDAVVEYRYGMPRLEVVRIRRMQSTKASEDKWRPSGDKKEIVKIYYAGAIDAASGSDEAKVHCEIYDADGTLEDTLVVEPPSGEFREIPLVPIYGGRKAPFEADPPYYDQAEAQAAYWRALSRHDWKARAIAKSMLFQSGVNYEGDVPEGGAGTDDESELVWCANPQGRGEILETNGQALNALREDLERRKKAIREGTMQATLSRPAGDVTAFEIGVSSIRANSRIEADTVFLEGSVQTLLEYTSALGGLSQIGRTSIPHDFGLPAAGIENVAGLYKEGKITPEGFLPIAKEAGWFPDSWNVEAEVKRLKDLNV